MFKYDGELGMCLTRGFLYEYVLITGDWTPQHLIKAELAALQCGKSLCEDADAEFLGHRSLPV